MTSYADLEVCDEVSARDLKVRGLKLGKRECVVHIAEKQSGEYTWKSDTPRIVGFFAHAQTVNTRPFFCVCNWPGYEARETWR